MKYYSGDKRLIERLSSQIPFLHWTEPDEDSVRFSVSLILHCNPHGFGLRLKLARVKAGESLRNLAKKIGSGFTSISTWEAGRSVPDLDILARIADALGLPSIADLLPFSEEENENYALSLKSQDFKDISDDVPGILTAIKLHQTDRPWINTSEYLRWPKFAFELPDNSMEKKNGVSLWSGCKVLCSAYDLERIRTSADGTWPDKKKRLLKSCNNKLVCCRYGPTDDAMIRELKYNVQTDTVKLLPWNTDEFPEIEFPGVGDEKRYSLPFLVYGRVVRLIEDFD